MGAMKDFLKEISLETGLEILVDFLGVEMAEERGF